MSEGRIVALEAEVRELRGLLEQSLSSRGPSTAATLGTGVANEPDDSAIGDEPVTRRAALRTAGVLAAGAIAGGVGMVASATPAAATTAGPYTATATDPALSVVAANGKSALVATGDTGAWSLPAVDVAGPLAIRATATQVPSGVAVRALGGTAGIGVDASGGVVGVKGVSPRNSDAISFGGEFEGNFGVRGIGLLTSYGGAGYGVVALGERSALVLGRINPPPSSRTISGSVGLIDIDVNGDVWLCTGEGTPGTWRKISGPSAAGAFHAIAPVRAYDSRKSAYTLNGTIANSTNRTVSVADSHATSDGTLVTSGVVPAGATAVAANVTVTGTTGTGYFCINPGGTTTLGASTINWYTSGQTLANGVILALDANRQVTIVAGNAVGSAHCIIDVTGYWL